MEQKNDADMQDNIIPITSSEAEVVLYQPDENIRLEVRVEHDSVWLSQAQMGQLFGTNRQAITKHIKNIYETGELDRDATSSILELVQTEGNRKVRRKIEFYNLDTIISVGFRVNTRQGILFRTWANNVLKQYLLQGYTVNHQLIALQERIDSRFTTIEQTLQQHEQQINFFVRTNQPPHEGVVFEGHLLEGRQVAEALIKSATTEVILIDGYVGVDTFHILETRASGVQATIYTDSVGPRIQSFQADHESEYGTTRHIEVRKYRTDFHDRFLIIDDDVYHFGASLKDLGKRLFAFDKMGLSKALILSQV